MSLPCIDSSIEHYDEIPQYCLGNAILDVGSSNGQGAVMSKYGDYFKQHDYLGIDIQQFSETYLPILQHDIESFKATKQFDTILMLHILEHIPFEKWKKIIEKYIKMLKPNGYLVVNVPHKQKEVKSDNNEDEHLDHCVFNIDKHKLNQVCEFDEFYYIRTRPIKRSNESFIRSFLRLIYRIVTNHKYSIFNEPFYKRIIAIKQKKD